MINYIKNNKLLLILVIILIPLLFINYINGSSIFELSLDQQNQYNLFYHEWFQMLNDFKANRNFPFWSWDLFLGSNFYASKSYYLVGDPFTYLAYFISSLTKDYMIYIVIIKIIVSSLLFNSYLSRINIKNNVIRNVFSLVYGLSGFALIFVSEYMFHSFYTILPLLFIGIEYFYSKRRNSIFIIAVFLLLMTNYYLFFPTTIVMAIYILFRNMMFYKLDKEFIKNLFLNNYILVIGYIIGVLLTGILLIPAALFILDNPRIGNNNNLTLFWDAKVYLSTILNMFTMPFSLYTRLNYPFYTGTGGHAHWFTLYSTVVIPLLIPQLFINRDKTKKIIIGFLSTLFIFLIFPFLSSILHGFSEPSTRWTFLITFMIIAVAAYVLDKIEINKKVLLNTFIGIIASIIVLTSISIIFNIISINKDIYYLLFLGIGVILLSIYTVCLLNKKYIILIILIVIELSSSWFIRFNILQEEYLKYDYPLNKEYIEYFKGLDNYEFTRIYIDPHALIPFNDVNYNQSLYYDYSSTITYDTTYQYSLKQFLNWNGINWHIININNPELLKLLGVKYYGVTEESKLPQGTDFEYSHNLNHVMMYRIIDSNAVGHTFSNFINESEFNNAINWNETLIVSDELYSQIADIKQSPKVQMLNPAFYNSGMTAYISVTDKQVLFLAIPYDKGWKFTLNDQEIKHYKVDGGFTGIILEPGDYNIKGYFVPSGLKLGALSTALGGLLFIINFIVIYRNNRKPRQ